MTDFLLWWLWFEHSMTRIVREDGADAAGLEKWHVSDALDFLQHPSVGRENVPPRMTVHILHVDTSVQEVPEDANAPFTYFVCIRTAIFTVDILILSFVFFLRFRLPSRKG